MQELNEAKLEEVKLNGETDSVIKEFFLSSSGEKELGALFGQSESELKKEFGSYKAQKIYRRLNLIIDNRDKLLGEVKSQLKEALKYGFNAVTVFPSVIELAKSVLKGAVKVRALINYPYGEELTKTLNYSVKHAVKSGADELLITFPTFEFRSGDVQNIVKNLKKTVFLAKGRRVSVLLDLSILTLPEIESAISTLLSTGVYSAVLSYGSGERIVSKAVVEDAVNASVGLIKIECITPLCKAEDAVSLLLSGAGTVISKNVSEVATDLSGKIEVLGASETLDK
ncbi:MAG: hypothetical protein IKL82_01315 [Clostridia bacterium]|nr:hypothetical protein [Clostridia bacterium]